MQISADARTYRNLTGNLLTHGQEELIYFAVVSPQVMAFPIS